MTSSLRRPSGIEQFTCRICDGETFSVLDLGHHPFANALISDPHQVIKTYPLAVRVCSHCSGAQLSYCADDHELYSNYLYLTPESDSLSAHYRRIHDFLVSKDYVNNRSSVLEIGSNIGRFLEFLAPRVEAVLGVDPAANICKLANDKGIPTITDFFNKDSAHRICAESGRRDVVVARHCFAHNEKPWLMVEGVKEILAVNGVFLIENAYFLDTILKCEFDQFYHEHMYYYGVRSMQALLKKSGFKIIDLFHSPIHGGAMLFVAAMEASSWDVSAVVEQQLEVEKEMHQPDFYGHFQDQVDLNRHSLIGLLNRLKAQGKTVHAYGASAKSTTLLNYYHINKELVPCIVDSTKEKIGKYIPFANIEVISEEEASHDPPDYYLLTVWNYKEEIIRKVRGWGHGRTRFILPHPSVQMLV